VLVLELESGRPGNGVLEFWSIGPRAFSELHPQSEVEVLSGRSRSRNLTQG
jgi:hypothetical protein